MFALQYGDSFLELAGRESPLIRWVSTAFNDDQVLEGSGSYPIDLAPSAANDALLNFSTHLANRMARKDIEVVVHLMNQPWKRCTYSYEIRDGQPSGHLKIDNGELANRLKNIELPNVFVKTTNGVFADHEWLLLGTSPTTTGASVEASLAQGAAPYTFFPQINEGLFGTFTPEDEEAAPYDENTRIINRWFSYGFLVSNSDAEVNSGMWYNPSFYLTWVIKKVCRFLGYEAIGDFFESDFINSLVIDNNSVYNLNQIFAEGGFSIAPALHLPNIKLTDFFKKLRGQFKLVYYFNSNTKQVHFQLGSSVLSSPERVDLDGYVEKRKLTTTKFEETGYELIQPIDSKDKLSEDLPYTKSFFIGETLIPKKVEVPIGTTFMKYEINQDQTGTPVWRIPIKNQLGNAFGIYAKGSAAYNPEGWGRNQWELRLISYQGLQQDADSLDYPYATSDGLAPDNTTVLSDSCWLGGSRGILEIYHKLWYVFLLRTEKVELSARLTSLLLNQLSPLKKVRWATDEGVHLEALLSQVEFTADENKQLLKSEITVYPFYNQQAADLPGYSNFTGGEIENANPTFVKMEIVETSRTFRRKFLGARVLESIISSIIYTFYSDFAATIPKSVTNLEVNRVNHRISTDGNSDYPISLTANGFTLVQTGLITYYWKGDDMTRYTFTLSEGDYVRLT